MPLRPRDNRALVPTARGDAIRVMATNRDNSRGGQVIHLPDYSVATPVHSLDVSADDKAR